MAASQGRPPCVCNSLEPALRGRRRRRGSQAPTTCSPLDHRAATRSPARDASCADAGHPTRVCWVSVSAQLLPPPPPRLATTTTDEGAWKLLVACGQRTRTWPHLPHQHAPPPPTPRRSNLVHGRVATCDHLHAIAVPPLCRHVAAEREPWPLGLYAPALPVVRLAEQQVVAQAVVRHALHTTRRTMHGPGQQARGARPRDHTARRMLTTRLAVTRQSRLPAGSASG
jgi:hypothetical protein